MPLSLLQFRVKLESCMSSTISFSGNASRGMAHNWQRSTSHRIPDVDLAQLYSKGRFDRAATRRQAMRHLRLAGRSEQSDGRTLHRIGCTHRPLQQFCQPFDSIFDQIVALWNARYGIASTWQKSTCSRAPYTCSYTRSHNDSSPEATGAICSLIGSSIYGGKCWNAVQQSNEPSQEGESVLTSTPARSPYTSRTTCSFTSPHTSTSTISSTIFP